MGKPSGTMTDLAVMLVAVIAGWALLIASWRLNGRVGEVFNLAALAAFAFSVAWLLSGRAKRGGDGR
ncbi:MAG: hypothetical protein HFJ74_01370 [Eggerthellaceae bacterium]|jgi:hypothetical protein|nr:hypothetical protein [Eggerthellaceae bacterium]